MKFIIFSADCTTISQFSQFTQCDSTTLESADSQLNPRLCLVGCLREDEEVLVASKVSFSP